MTPRPLFVVPGRLQSSVLGRLKSSHRRILLLDFDGTLAPLRSTPAKARLPVGTKTLIRKLTRRPHTWVFLVTGRSLKDIAGKTRLTGVGLVANHGFEIATRHRRWIHPAARKAAPALRMMVKELSETLKPVGGVLVEDKTYTLSVHFRNVRPSRVPLVLKTVNRLVRGYGELLATTHGKKVVEVRPAVEWNKGFAVEKVLGALKWSPADFVTYLGDDRTDEDAFRALKNRATTVIVEYDRRSAAGYWVEDPRAVAGFLNIILFTRAEGKER